MGTLYIVATPIGNLKDMTIRAIEILRSVDFVVCEDTRIFGKLAHQYQITAEMLAMNDFNEVTRIPQILAILASGKNVALVSDSGTPLVSDPGYKLVREAIAKGVRVESIPGPSSVIAALTVSGLAPDKFTFVGYLPKKNGQRLELLRKLAEIRGILRSTYILFESPYRLFRTLESIREVFGDVEVVICRELTKLHEEVRREKVSDSIDHFPKVSPKGEFVLLI